MNRIDPFIEFEMIAFDNSALWLKLKGAHILITGGTGFFGKWILEFLSFINSQLGLDLTVSVLSRSPDHFAKSMPHLFQEHFLNLVKGDVRTFNPSVNSYSHIIHGAAPANLLMDIERPHDMFDVIVSGTRNILNVANKCRDPVVLFISSGAVYGPLSNDIEEVPETCFTASDRPRTKTSGYMDGKRAAEYLCTKEWKTFETRVLTLRCFAFLGPYLPVDSHFAIGNFIYDAVQQKPPMIKGDGQAIRSYLYSSDLAYWVTKTLIVGEPGDTINIGSDKAITIGDLARTISRILGAPPPVILNQVKTHADRRRYVPSMVYGNAKYGLEQTVSLEEGVLRTAHFLDWSN